VWTLRAGVEVLGFRHLGGIDARLPKAIPHVCNSVYHTNAHIFFFKKNM